MIHITEGFYIIEIVWTKTNVLSSDTDGDNLPDLWEINNGLNPNDNTGANGAQGDPDGDTIINLLEQQYGTNPRNPRTFNDGQGQGQSDADYIAQITQLNYISRSLRYDFDDYEDEEESDGPQGDISTIASWEQTTSTPDKLSASVPVTSLSSRLASAKPFLVQPPAQISSGQTPIKSHSRVLPPCAHAQLEHRRYWLRRSSPSASPVSRTYILITERKIDGQPVTPPTTGTNPDAPQVITLTIPANETTSQPIDVITSFKKDATGNVSHEETIVQKLLPVEVKSTDLAFSGSFDVPAGWTNLRLKFEGVKRSGGTLSYSIPPPGTQSADTFIYDTEEGATNGLFNDTELNQSAAAVDPKKKTDVVFWREGNKIHFASVADQIGEVRIILNNNGTDLGTIKHQLTADAEFHSLLAAIEAMVAGDAPPGTGSLPPPIFASVLPVPNLTESDRNQLTSMVSVQLAAVFPWFQPPTPPGGPAPAPIFRAADFAEWLRIVRLSSTDAQWAPVVAFLSSRGYDAAQAVGNQFLGWGNADPPDAELDLPAEIRNRGLIARICIEWIKKKLEIGIQGGKGLVYGLWDGLKSEWEDVEASVKLAADLYNTLKDPWKCAAELYHMFQAVKSMTIAQLKGAAVALFDVFLGPLKNIQLPPKELFTAGLFAYVIGYVSGYIGEQALINVLVGPLKNLFKGGKFIRTLLEQIDNVVNTLTPQPALAGNIPKWFTQSMSNVTEKGDDLRAARAVASKQRYGRVPNGKNYAGELSVSDTTARTRLDAALKGITGDAMRAHHLVPWSMRSHPLVQKAARAGFNINGKDNGILLPDGRHPSNHPGYNDAVESFLDEMHTKAPSLSDHEAAAEMLEFADKLRDMITKSNNRLTMLRLELPNISPVRRSIHDDLLAAPIAA